MICVALQETNVTKCLQILNTVELAEIRIDLAKLSIDDVQKIFSESKTPLIATCRPDNYSDEERLILLKTAITAGAKYVDIEIENNLQFTNELVDFAKKNNTVVIISYHNYENTPDSIELASIIATSFNLGADIAKIATMINETKDISRLLQLYDRNDQVVVLGMGEKGKITRIIAPFLGSPFTFASLDDSSSTAPGQISLKHLKEIQEQLVNI
jgi:3-dehydroquinate dehydratase-1